MGCPALTWRARDGNHELVTSTLKILEILEAAQIEQPRAKAIVAAIDDHGKITSETASHGERSLRTWMHETFATKADLADLRAEMKGNKADQMKWVFLFWIGQTAVLGGLIKLLQQ